MANDSGITIWLFASAIVVGILTILVWHVKFWRMYKLASKLPGPRTVPLLGNALMFLGDYEDILNKFQNMAETYGSPVRFWVGPMVNFLVTDADHVKDILSSNNMLDKNYIYDFGKDLLGSGLVTAPVNIWMEHRKLVRPSLNSARLRSFFPIFRKKAKLLAARLANEIDGPEFPVLELFSSFTLSTVLEAAVGVELDMDSAELLRYGNSIHTVLTTVVLRTVSFWCRTNFMFNLTRYKKPYDESIAYCHSFVRDVIEKRKKTYFDRMNKQNEAIDEDDLTSSVQQTFFDFLLHETHRGNKFTDQDLFDEVMTIIVAGHDTAAITLSFVMLMLASYPDIQEKVYQELREIYEDNKERDVSFEDINRMEYMERVIKETLRLFPVAPVIGRKPIADTIMGEHVVPVGSSMFIGIISVHRNEKYWQDPLRFDPDRFLPEETTKRHPYCYLPFAAGPRNCPGGKYAMILMKVVVATLLRSYVIRKNNILPIPDIRLAGHTLIKPVEPITLGLERRN